MKTLFATLAVTALLATTAGTTLAEDVSLCHLQNQTVTNDCESDGREDGDTTVNIKGGDTGGQNSGSSDGYDGGRD